ncbi:hypothetical protein POM88_051563 [Heracleum sosnowskyi]|uniref:Uncharacterized protein n=1 Tax=Heracleum sosnowskyi TaxID=360622 RepID=A0AAD8M3L2_9APIA|nr:hypothetical protein POM88_051563 [Heracleum sosnowskyi]
MRGVESNAKDFGSSAKHWRKESIRLERCWRSVEVKISRGSAVVLTFCQVLYISKRWSIYTVDDNMSWFFFQCLRLRIREGMINVSQKWEFSFQLLHCKKLAQNFVQEYKGAAANEDHGNSDGGGKEEHVAHTI